MLHTGLCCVKSYVAKASIGIWKTYILRNLYPQKMWKHMAGRCKAKNKEGNILVASFSYIVSECDRSIRICVWMIYNRTTKSPIIWVYTRAAKKSLKHNSFRLRTTRCYVTNLVVQRFNIVTRHRSRLSWPAASKTMTTMKSGSIWVIVWDTYPLACASTIVVDIKVTSCRSRPVIPLVVRHKAGPLIMATNHTYPSSTNEYKHFSIVYFE